MDSTNFIIIPYPNQIVWKENEFEIPSSLKIKVPFNSTYDWSTPLKFLEKEFHLNIEWIREEIVEADKPHINLKLNSSDSKEQKEAYQLHIDSHTIVIKGKAPCGIFYGIQTFHQLFNSCVSFNKSTRKADTIDYLPCCSIIDSPRFKWRGFMLDVGRHFHSVATIKKYLDLMAFFKLNKFHWHLTEDQGWRIEIKQYPKLKDIGGKRDDTRVGGFKSKTMRGKPHEGYYTQEEIKEVVEYAQDRFIQVIPEIEVPGHSSAAIAAYPELGCENKPLKVPTKFGIFQDIYCAGKEYTFTFLENVFDEILNLFPSKLIHIGGDEAPKKRWKVCEACQRRIQEENLADEHELQVYFTNRINRYLKENGRTVIGWNEILHEGLDSEAIVQYWLRNKKEVINALNSGRKVINSSFKHYYLDYKYTLHPLRKVYNYDPMFPHVNPQAQKNLLGIEAPLWTEWVPNEDRMAWQVFPRLLAVAESAWTENENKNYSLFKDRLSQIYSWLHQHDVKPASLEEVDPHGIKRFLQFFTLLKMPKI